MLRLTQSNTDPGNCWQTAIACILEIDPETMPSQSSYDGERKTGWLNYQNVLQGYLLKHFGLGYSEVWDTQFSALRVAGDGWHMLIGPTSRTEMNRKAGKPRVDHVIVGRDGLPVWDVHPSREGLLAVERWGILAPVPGRIIRERRERAEAMATEGRDDALEFRRVFIDCLCPSCCSERGEPSGASPDERGEG